MSLRISNETRKRASLFDMFYVAEKSPDVLAFVVSRTYYKSSHREKTKQIYIMKTLTSNFKLTNAILLSAQVLIVSFKILLSKQNCKQPTIGPKQNWKKNLLAKIRDGLNILPEVYTLQLSKFRRIGRKTAMLQISLH